MNQDDRDIALPLGAYDHGKNPSRREKTNSETRGAVTWICRAGHSGTRALESFYTGGEKRGLSRQVTGTKARAGDENNLVQGTARRWSCLDPPPEIP